jgi:two-component system nitrogen regulation response regulator NtrX
MALVDAAARHTFVVVAGSSDSERDLVARALHVRAHRADGPFVRVDCAKLAAGTLERELFGTVAPGGTGDEVAETVTRASRVHQAIGGTLFLEHAAGLPPVAQTRLARLLARRQATLEPEGHLVAVDVRVIIAADDAFDRACEDGRMLTDLHGTPGATRITVPSTETTTPGEIPALAVQLLADLCEEARVPGKELTSLAQILLTAVVNRSTPLELRFLLEEIVKRVPRRVIRVEDVVTVLRIDMGVGTGAAASSLREAREHFERKYIADVIERHQGRIPHAARTLGIQRANLYRKLRTLNWDPPSRRGRGQAARSGSRVAVGIQNSGSTED